MQLVTSNIPWMKCCPWNLLMKTRAFIISFTNHLPIFISITNYTFKVILKSLLRPTRNVKYHKFTNPLDPLITWKLWN